MDIFQSNKNQLGGKSKIKNMQFEHSISCDLEMDKSAFLLGDLFRKLILVNSDKFSDILKILEHKGIINSLFKLSNGGMLSVSADKKNDNI